MIIKMITAISVITITLVLLLPSVQNDYSDNNSNNKLIAHHQMHPRGYQVNLHMYYHRGAAGFRHSVFHSEFAYVTCVGIHTMFTFIIESC